MGWILRKTDGTVMKEVPIGTYSRSQTDIMESVIVPDDEEYNFVLLFDVISAARRNGAYSITRKGSQGDAQELVLLKRSRGPFKQASEHDVQVGSHARLAIQLPWLRGMRQETGSRVTVVPGTKITFRSIPGDPSLYEFPDRAAYENCDYTMAKPFRETTFGQTVVTAQEEGTRYFGADEKSCRFGRAKVIISVGKVLQLQKRSKCKRTYGYIERHSGWTVRQCSSACMRNRECLGYHHADSKERSRRQCLLLPYRPLVENADDVTPRKKRRRFNRFSCGVAE